MNVTAELLNTKFHWYTIKFSITSHEKLCETLAKESPDLHYFLIQGFDRHLFTKQKIPQGIVRIFKKKIRNKILVLYNRRMLYLIQPIQKRASRAHECNSQHAFIHRITIFKQKPKCI